MNILETELLRTIRKSVIGVPEKLDVDAPWGLIYEVSKNHKITPIVYEGIHDLEISPDIKRAFFDDYKRQALLHFKQEEQLTAICEAFEKNGIDYMVLKGEDLKNLYPKPEMRHMWDLDILIKPEQVPQISSIMTGLGFAKKGECDREILYTDGSLVFVELHRFMFLQHHTKISNYFGDGWKRAFKKDTNKHRYYLSVEDEFIFLFSHFTKHFRDGGIGIRHMIDLYLYFNHHSNMDIKYVENELAKLELLDFCKNVFETLKVWFSCKEDTDITLTITKRVIQSGSFGTKSVYHAAIASRMVNKYKSTFWGKVRFALRALCPPVSVIQERHPIVKKVPFLLPYFWFERALRGIFIKKVVLEFELSKFNSINRKTVSDYQSDLEKVGLKKEF